MFAGIPIIVKHTKYSDIRHDAAPKAASKLASDYSSRKRGRFVQSKIIGNESLPMIHDSINMRKF